MNTDDLFHEINLDTIHGVIEYVRGFTDEQLRALSGAETTPSRLVVQMAADMELYRRNEEMR